MFLTPANLFHHRLHKKFADPANSVSGSYTVHTLSRRNQNFRVTSGTREYLVKQVRKWDADGRAGLNILTRPQWPAEHLLESSYR